MDYSQYQSKVMKAVNEMYDVMKYTRYDSFSISKILNIIADCWRYEAPIISAVRQVKAYIDKIK